MVIKDLKIPGAFSFLLEIINRVLDGKRLPFRYLKMLSSRFSGKTHNVLYIFYIALLIQTKKRVVVEFVRSRSLDAEKELNKMINKVLECFPNAKIKSQVKHGIFEVNGNKFRITTLNEEKNKVSKDGGKVGLLLEEQAEYFFVFYEECSQLNGDLVENHRHGVRGSSKTEQMFIYASNPWVRANWFVAEFIKYLPEGTKEREELDLKGYNSRYVSNKNCLYFRPRWTLNIQNLTKDTIDDIEALKLINIKKYDIVSYGFSGSLNSSLYSASLEKANTKLEKHVEHQFYGGMDWGDGKSAGGSPSIALILGISIDYGVDMYGELEWFNNRGVVLTTEEQLTKFANFYIEFYKNNLEKSWKKQMLTIYVDNASLGDFFQLFQQIFNQKGYGKVIEVLPAVKPKNTWERVEVVNFLLSTGALRLNEEISPRLWYYLENCYEVPKTNPKENDKRERSHEFTHGIHALEYGIGSFLYEFRENIPLFDNKSNGKYAII